MIRKRGWDLLIIPAIAPEAEVYRIGSDECEVYRRSAGEVLLPDREPPDVLDSLKIEMGTMNFAAQYQQDPAPPGGNIIQRDWLRFYDEEPREFLRTLSSWDLASTIGERSSYSVGLLWGELDRKYYLLELVRGKYETPTLRKLIIEREIAWDPTATIIEKTELGESICQDLRRTTDLRPKLMSARIDKEARLLTQAARFEAGRVLLPKGATWLEEYVSELLAFPYGRHDDQVDATSQALHVLTGRSASQTVSMSVRSF